MATNHPHYSSEGSLGDQLGTSTDIPNVPQNLGTVSQNFLTTNVAHAETGTTYLGLATVPIYYSLWFWVAFLIVVTIMGSYALRTSKK